jgi:hypothetical protein
MMRVRYSSKLFLTGRKQPPNLNPKPTAQTHTSIGMYYVGGCFGAFMLEDTCHSLFFKN